MPTKGSGFINQGSTLVRNQSTLLPLCAGPPFCWPRRTTKASSVRAFCWVNPPTVGDFGAKQALIRIDKDLVGSRYRGILFYIPICFDPYYQDPQQAPHFGKP